MHFYRYRIGIYSLITFVAIWLIMWLRYTSRCTQAHICGWEFAMSVRKDHFTTFQQGAVTVLAVRTCAVERCFLGAAVSLPSLSLPESDTGHHEGSWMFHVERYESERRPWQEVCCVA